MMSMQDAIRDAVTAWYAQPGPLLADRMGAFLSTLQRRGYLIVEATPNTVTVAGLSDEQLVEDYGDNTRWENDDLRDELQAELLRRLAERPGRQAGVDMGRVIDGHEYAEELEWIAKRDVSDGAG